MATRTGFRPRPLDTTRQLNIVRDIKELDDGEQKVSRDIVHSHEALDKDNEEVSSAQLLQLQQAATACIRMDALNETSKVHSCLICVYWLSSWGRLPTVMHTGHACVHERSTDVLHSKPLVSYATCALMATTCMPGASGCEIGCHVQCIAVHRLAWCLASKPKVERRSQLLLSEPCRRTVSSTCLFTRSPECTSEGRVSMLIHN